MKKIIATALTIIGTIIGTIATTGCFAVLLDEPTMPESLR